jgi:hypothetical protein
VVWDTLLLLLLLQAPWALPPAPFCMLSVPVPAEGLKTVDQSRPAPPICPIIPPFLLSCFPAFLLHCRAHPAEGPEAIQGFQAQRVHPLLKQPAGRWVDGWGLQGAKLGGCMADRRSIDLHVGVPPASLCAKPGGPSAHLHAAATWACVQQHSSLHMCCARCSLFTPHHLKIVLTCLFGCHSTPPCSAPRV